MGQTLYEKVFDAHAVRELDSGQYQLLMGLHLVHEVTSPQAFSMLRERGLRRALPRAHVRDRRPHHPDAQPGAPARRSPWPRRCCSTSSATAREFGIRFFDRRRRRAGHRARDRPRAGPHAARHDDLLRRLATPRRTARSARSRSASARRRCATCSPRQCLAMEQAQGAPDRGDRQAAPGRLREGRDPLHHQPARRARRRRLRLRVRRRGLRPLLDGGAHDRLQHVDRGRRALRLREPRRDDLRVPARPPVRAEGRCLGSRASRTGTSIRSDPDARYDDVVRIDAADIEPIVTWGITPGQSTPSRHAAARADGVPRSDERALIERGVPLHGARARQADRRARRSTSRSSARARTAASPTSRRSSAICEAARFRVAPHVKALVVPGLAGRARPSWSDAATTGLPRRGLRVPRGGLLDVPRDEPRQARSATSSAPRRRTATSRAARARPTGPHAADVAGDGRRRGDRRRGGRRPRAVRDPAKETRHDRHRSAP